MFQVERLTRKQTFVEQMLVVECQRCAFSSSRRIRNEPLSETDISLMKRRGHLPLGASRHAAGAFPPLTRATSNVVWNV
jgi:hypothetical protein